VRALLPEKDYMSIDFAQYLIEKEPELFFENIGFCYLGHKYYAYLINKDILLNNFTMAEKWIFRGFIDDFCNKLGTDKRHQQQDNLIAEISMIPETYRSSAVKGLGKLIGAEMLFDPLHVPDYPLDSKVGMIFREGLQQSFYEGIGAGFAETLHRFWRTLVPPDYVLSDVYEHMLNIEWQRYLSLMTKMPSSSHSLIKRGFESELQIHPVNQAIKNYIARRLSASKM
jgi:hypothetical protein